MRKIVALILLTGFACSNGVEKTEDKFFSLDNYFNQEQQRLSDSNIRPDKTVKRNQDSEHMQDAAINWATELALFRESDINKPAWKNSYSVNQSPVQISYSARDSSLRTREILIEKNQEGKVIAIKIKNRTENSLFSSEEYLIYRPDSLYLIDKKQKVLLLGSNHYSIVGKF